jgi:predicted SAM-dependent methyltransferase
MRLKNFRNREGYLWLNVASGRFTLKEFVNLDNSIFLLLEPFYPVIKFLINLEKRKIIEEYKKSKSETLILRHDCRKIIKFPDGSVDHILCSHFLEHVYPDECIKILKEFYRLLRKGGSLHIIVPSLEAIIEHYNKHRPDGNVGDNLVKKLLLSHEKRPSLKYRFLQFLSYEGMQHRWMYDRASMINRLIKLGFRISNSINCPSSGVRAEDGENSIHIFAVKE